MTSFKLLFMPNHSAISFYRIIEVTPEGVQWENSNKYDSAVPTVYEIPILSHQYHYGVEAAREFVGKDMEDDVLMLEILKAMFPSVDFDKEVPIQEQAEKIWGRHRIGSKKKIK